MRSNIYAKPSKGIFVENDKKGVIKYKLTVEIFAAAKENAVGCLIMYCVAAERNAVGIRQW